MALMSRRPRTTQWHVRHLAAISALVLLSAWLYGSKLDHEPLRQEEIQLGTSSSALVSDGWQDREGRHFPLLLHVSEETWLEPFPTYLAALMTTRRADPIDQLRWIAVLVGMLNVLFIYVLASRLFVSRAYGFLAAALLLLNPAHFTYSRIVVRDGVWMLPFVLVALIAFTMFLQVGKPWALMISSAALGASAYTQPAAALAAPLLMLAELLGLHRAKRLTRANAQLACGAFAVTLTPLLAWFLRYPSTYLDTFGRWFLHPAHLRNPVAWLQAATNWYTLTVWLGTYWDFFSPAHLLVNDKAPAFVGVFLLPVGVFIAYGVVESSLQSASRVQTESAVFWILTMGFAVCPMAAATFKEPRAIQRVLVIVPFGVLLAIVGVRTLWERGTPWSRTAVFLLINAAFAQFSLFYRDVMGPL